MPIVLNALEQVLLSIDAVDARGNPAAVETVRWTIDNPIARLLVTSDLLSAQLVAQSVGTARVNVLIDAKFGSDQTLLHGFLDVIIIPSVATSVEIIAGIPQNQP